MPLKPAPLDTRVNRDSALLSPILYDDDAASLHSRSDQDTDSEDDELIARARNSKELRARDRLVLMEEEEMDQLVTATRAKQDRQRRGSNLAIPNPLQIFKNTGRDRSQSPMLNSNNSVDGFRDEKRRARRTRRKQKKDRLLKEAQHGEDGQLMYEMESGGMREGSSTGDSSDREDSEEHDRRHLQLHSDRKSERRRKWKKWLFIHTILIVGFAFLSLLAWKLSVDKKKAMPTLVSNGTALFAPTTLIVSLDGFRADFLQRGLTPRLSAFIKEGVSPQYMNPSFPSVTFPNHYTLATGLYPESHGVVGNTFWDPELQAEFYYTDPSRSMDPKWWGGEPFWVTAEEQGLRTAVHMWPGSEAHIMDVEPSILDEYNGKEALANKAARILEFLDRPGMEDPGADVKDMRPQLIAAYVPNVDADGHKYGPNSTEIRTTISQVDDMMDQVFLGLEQRNLTGIVNVIVVSDHGMATTDVTRMIQMEDLIDMSKVDHVDGWPLVGVRPKDPAYLQELYEQAMEKGKDNPNIEIYLKDKDMPERYHFSNNDRIAPLWIIPKTGWAIVAKEEFDIEEAKTKGLVYHPRGLHGYDHEHPLMRAIFIARGPAFPHEPNSRVEPFQNTEVYNILCDSVGMKPIPNNGTLRLPLKTVGLHDSETLLEEPADPVPTATAEDVATGVMSISPVETSSAADPNEQPPTAVGVDPVDPLKEPETNPAEDNDGGSEEGDEQPKEFKSWQDYWDWLTGKVDDLWHKITSSEDGGASK
ncbi:putative Pyrophosphatase/phosphodiesterase [Seiridium unicorne]|uniref:Pyrophosphatase/phosphodiesterase n=1 Tax=Seiridium unicorne TaxID=138068 RepID=A0ABR2V2Y3_9PEZI